MPPVEVRPQVSAAQSLKCRCVLQTTTPDYAWRYQRVSPKIAAAVSFHLEDDPPESENVNRFLIYPAASLSAAADYFPALQSLIVFIHMHRTCSHALLHRAAHRLCNTHTHNRHEGLSTLSECQHSLG